MEQQNSEPRVLDSVERAKLGIKVLTMPYDEAEAFIDDYVSGKNYDRASIDLFKEQVATQLHIREKGSELFWTGGEIARLVMTSFFKNLPKPPVNGSRND